MIDVLGMPPGRRGEGKEQQRKKEMQPGMYVRKNDSTPLFVFSFTDASFFHFIQVLDGYTLHVCLEHLIPEYEELTKEQNRFIWCNKVQSVKVASKQLFDLLTKHEEECSERLLQIIRNCR